MLAVKDAYKRLFDLRNSEVESVILLQIIFFILLFCLLMIKPNASALFISEFGISELPKAFIAVAVFAGGVSQLYNWMGKYSIRRNLLNTIYLSSGLFILFGLLLSFGLAQRLTLYFLYVWVSIFALVSTSQFWLLGNLIFNANQAKRVFGIIGAGSIAGAVLGGYFSSGISILGGAKELSIFVGLILLVVPVFTKKLLEINDIDSSSLVQKGQKNFGFLIPVKLINQHRLLRNLTMLVFLNVLVSKIVDYEFGLFASRHFLQENELSAFYGFTYSTFNFVGFLLQLFITARVLKKIGVSSTLAILPTALFIFFAGLAILPGLFLVVLLKLSDSSLKQSFQRSSIELAMLPIPHYIKARTKTFIDVFVDSLATGIAGILIIILANRLGVSNIFILLLGGAASLFWIYVTSKTKQNYVEANVTQKSGKGRSRILLEPEAFTEKVKEMLKAKTYDQLTRHLEEGQSFDAIVFDQEANAVFEIPDENLKTALLNFCNRNPNIHIVFDLKSELESSQNNVLNQSLLNYAVSSDEYKDGDIYPLIDHPSHAIRIMTVYALVRFYGRTSYLEDHIQISKRLDELLAWSIKNEEEFMIRQCIQAMALYKVNGYYEKFSALLENSHPTVRLETVKALALTNDHRFLDRLIRYKYEPRQEEMIIQALASFGTGFLSYLENKEGLFSAKKLTTICRTLSRINDQRSADLLLGYLEHQQLKVRKAAIRNLAILYKANKDFVYFKEVLHNRILHECRHIRELTALIIETGNRPDFNVPYQKLSLGSWIIFRLQELSDESLLRIFQMLDILLPGSRFDPIISDFLSVVPEKRKKALSQLESLLPPKLTKVLIPLLESYQLDNKAASMLETVLPKKALKMEKYYQLKDKELNALLDQLPSA